MAEMQPIEEAPENNKPSAYISDRHRNPNEVDSQTTATGNYALAGICAILATVTYVAMLALLWFDWQALQSA